MKRADRLVGWWAATWFLVAPSFGQAVPPKPFVYFMDTIDDGNITLAGTDTAVIGEIGPGTNVGERGYYTAQGQVVGVTAALFREYNLWTYTVPADPANGIPNSLPSLETLFSNPVDLSTPSARTAFATQILTSTLRYPVELPQPAEAQPNGNGGYVLWTQDFEMNSSGDTAQQMAAGITAILWAGRQLAGSGTLVIPVPSSSIQKATPQDWQLDQVLTSDSLVGKLGLADTFTNPNDRTNLGSMDLLSMLHLVRNTDTAAPLLDGFLAQQYQLGTIGTFSADEVHFYDTSIPYAIMSAHDHPAQLPATPPAAPFATSYSGPMPFQAGVYWQDDPILGTAAFNPAEYLRPEEHSLAELVPEPMSHLATAVGAAAVVALRCRRCHARARHTTGRL